MADDQAEPARDKLEPEAAQIADGMKAAMVSQAISLKRIADGLTAIGDAGALTGTISNMAWEAGRSFAAGQRTDR